MPLFKTIVFNGHTTIYVWKIEESLSELTSNIILKEESKCRIDNMKSELHQRGFVSVRHLLKTAGYNDHDLSYSHDGKPHLKNGKYISITHSFIFSAIIISNKEVGIDIEKNREKITKIAHKFVDYENQFLTENQLIEQLTVIWGAKESLYKIDPKNGYSFKDSIFIEPFKLTDLTTTGTIRKDNYKHDFSIHFEIIEDFTLVYAFK